MTGKTSRSAASKRASSSKKKSSSTKRKVASKSSRQRAAAAAKKRKARRVVDSSSSESSSSDSSSSDSSDSSSEDERPRKTRTVAVTHTPLWYAHRHLLDPWHTIHHHYGNAQPDMRSTASRITSPLEAGERRIMGRVRDINAAPQPPPRTGRGATRDVNIQ